MSIRVPRAGLCLTTLLGLSATLSAKPPDLPLPFQDTVAPKVQGEGGFVNDLFPMSPGGGEEGEAKPCPQAGPVYRIAPMARPVFQLPPSVRRSLAECVLFGVHPLMLLVPVGECLDAPCDHPPVAPESQLEDPVLLTQAQDSRQRWRLDPRSVEVECEAHSDPVESCTESQSWWTFFALLLQNRGISSTKEVHSIGWNSDAGFQGSIVLNIEDGNPGYQWVQLTHTYASTVDGSDPRWSKKVMGVGGRGSWRFREKDELGFSARLRDQVICKGGVTIVGDVNASPLEKLWNALVLRIPEQQLDDSDFPWIYTGSPLNNCFVKADELITPEPLQVMPKKEKPTKEREIEYQLSLPVTLNFTDTPLKQVIDDLHNWQGINVYFDREALDAEGISIDRPVTIKLQDIALKTALTLLLKQAHLTYVVKDDVLQITTEAEARGKLMTRTYPVADLIDADASALLGVDVPPWIKLNKEETLVSFITYNVLPRSWADVGGKASVEFHSPTQSLVVNQTPDGQEAVENVLALVRKQTKEAQDRRKEAEKQRERAVAAKPARIVRVNVVVPKNDPRLMEVVRKAVVEARKDNKAKLCVIVDGKVVGEEACEEEQEPRTASKAVAKPYRAEGQTCPSCAKGVAAAEDKAAGLHFVDLLDRLGHVFKEGGCAEVGIGSNGLRFRGQVHLHGNTYHLRFGGAGGVCVWTMSHPAEKTEDAQQEK
jgi:hypothetical protein